MSNTIQLTVHDSHVPSNFKTYQGPLSRECLLEFGIRELKMQDAQDLYFDNGSLVEKISDIQSSDHIYIHNGKTLDSDNDVFHLCMLGAGAIGKSALTLQFIQGQFIQDYDPTIEDAYRKHITVDGSSLLLDVLDTAGQEDFFALRTSWMRNKDGFILGFSIIERKSFEDLDSFYDQLCEVYEDNVPPFILCGNKVDLAKTKRQVSFEEAEAKAKQWKAIQYIETSAKTAYNVPSMFGTLVREVIAIQYQEQLKRKKTNKKSFWCQIL